MLILELCLDAVWERVRYTGTLLSVVVLSESIACSVIISNFGDVDSVSAGCSMSLAT